MAFIQALSDTIKSILPTGLTQTENGALSHSTTGDARLNYFAKVLRDTQPTDVKQHLRESWSLSPLDTLKLIAQKRDCRGGSGEKKVFYESVRWLVDTAPDAALVFMSHVPYFGTWKDGFYCFAGTPLEPQWLKFVVDQLQKDLAALQNQSEDIDASTSDLDVKKSRKSVSLCAKWVPSEGSSLDRRYKGIYSRLVVSMGLSGSGSGGNKEFRQRYISPLRAYINIVERMMCGKQWDDINYSQVPSVAMNRLRKAFKKNDATRFAQFLADVKSGKTSIKAGQLFPHEMVKTYLGYSSAEDAVIEEQWKAYVKLTQQLGQLEKCCVLSDVSGSMNSNNNLPLSVSVALGLLIATVTKGAFNGAVLTFHESPTFHMIDVTKSLQQQVKQLQSAPWGGNTNFQAAFDLILERALKFRLKQEDMPESLIVISDMQFDIADRGGSNYFTNFETIRAKYRKAGYTMPKIIFWNVAGRTEDFPVNKSEYGVAMLSGFSPSHLKYLTTGQIANPYSMMREVIDSERYACVTIPDKYMK